MGGNISKRIENLEKQTGTDMPRLLIFIVGGVDRPVDGLRCREIPDFLMLREPGESDEALRQRATAAVDEQLGDKRHALMFCSYYLDDDDMAA